ncbi:SMP-30/gluconolactonase/LRE family protein [Microbacterium hominis]|uniref:Superoxide dismutase n=1 Tax=Microbacterium hominis TaxID=162426 RepID=A0A7D4TGZ2_9MICO|nr:superoxide dismutase [Microbacterium hominis]QKJ19721.1 superoxide dismutase [Microbacterium hominis]
MSGRSVARTFAALTLTGLLVVTAGAAYGAQPSRGGGAVEDIIPLPDGFQPEGIAIGPGGTAYLGSLADGDIYAVDVRTGEGEIISEGPGTPSVGLKIDQFGRLFVAGGPTGTARVIDATTGGLIAEFELASDTPFINDVILTRHGAWFTNSFAPELSFLPIGPSGELPDAPVTVPLTGEWVQQPSFNANGIVETPDHRALLVIQSATATLFRVDPDTGEATAVDLGGASLPAGDGLLVVGRTLYVVQNQLNQVAVVRLNASGTTGVLVETLTDPAFRVPTTVARFGSSLLLPNARFDVVPTPDTEYEVVRIDR